MRNVSLFTVLALFLSAPALAQTGVSDDRVSLPEGPGSMEGVGEDAEVNASMGLMSHSVPVSVTPGYKGLTPNISLSYTSGGSNDLLGMGWGMSLPAIERLTKFGLCIPTSWCKPSPSVILFFLTF